MIFRLLKILPFILTGALFGQTAQERAETDLRLAREQLNKLVAAINREEGDLVREVEKLDDAVIASAKKLSKLLRDEDKIAGKQRQLDNELARRKGEFEFTFSSLRSYGNSVKNRINSSEKQGFGREIEEARRAADATGDDLVAEVSARLKLLELAATRLTQVHGGQVIPGQAEGEGSVVKDGQFVIAGPLGYFSANDGSLNGFTALAPEGVDIPKVSALEADKGGEAIAALAKSGEATVPVDATMGKALKIARTQKTLGDYLEGGGVVGYAILAVGVLALLIAVFKLIEINSFPIPSRKKINLIIDDLLGHRVSEAEDKAKALSGLSGQMVQSGVTYFFDKRRILEDALLEKLGVIQPKLERFLPFLALVAAAAPMMGLLGTVLGIMETFAMMSAVGAGDSSAFSAGISAALITTAMGLIVAIPVIIIHGLLKSLAKAKFGQAEGVALSLLNGTTEIESAPGDLKPDEGGDDGEDYDEKDLVTA